ncbi:MAG: hypothetical protein ACLPWS_22570 [Rhodomicrobium sp.]
MAIEDQPDFPRFNTVSSGLKEAEERMLDAVKSGNKAEIAAAKLALMAALDEYRKTVDGIGEDLP